MSPKNKDITPPDFKALLDMWKVDVMLSINCHAIGTIESFDATKQTVQASINYARVRDGKTIQYPILIDCPLVGMQGGAAALTMPVAKGDTCLLLFNDRDIDNWFASGQVMPPASDRLHAFTDALAVVGLRSKRNPITAYDGSRAVLRNDTTGVGVGTAKVKVYNAATTLGAQIDALMTNLVAFMTSCESSADPTVSAAATTSMTALTNSLPAIKLALEGLLE